MHEHAPPGGETSVILPELAEARLLTDVDNLLTQIRLHGAIPDQARTDDRQNKATALCEAAIPAAVTSTEHKVEHQQGLAGRRERVITWLGKNAVQLARDGYQYHFSTEARQRVDIEVAEAAHAQETLQPGVAQVFISPKMSASDAPSEIAKAEHLYDDDSLRVSYAVSDGKGEVVGRKMQSLLVKDIPLSAWVAMLKDEANVFGQSFVLEDERSALSVMKLFKELDISEERLPEGPITLVEAVLPYIDDSAAKDSVQHQIEAFRGDQTFYAKQADKKAREWSAFDAELAYSLEAELATDPIRRHIIRLQHDWNQESLEVINRHALGDAQYRMTRELAALLERSERTLLEARVAVMVGNDEATKHVSEETKATIIAQETQLESMVASGVSPLEIAQLQANQMRLVIRQDIRTGGGCAGSVRNAFGTSGETDGQDMLEPDAELMRGVGEDGNPFEQKGKKGKSSWKWKSGVCQVKACPTRPGATKVGPCSVCVRCQHKFDMGLDPTKSAELAAKPRTDQPEATVLRPIFGEKSKRETQRVGKGVLEPMLAA